MTNDMEINDFDFGAILNGGIRRQGQTLNGRRALDKKKLSEADRRKIQTTGRTEQMNLRVRPMTKVEFMQHAASQNLLPTELFERAWEFYKSNGGS
ncbi:MAG: hypothetical protein HOO99_03215 [Hyphomicrobiaceae bacterium]|nr:hypothetical protein [Hyphomicrobiaceae bacterium]